MIKYIKGLIENEDVIKVSERSSEIKPEQIKKARRKKVDSSKMDENAKSDSLINQIELKNDELEPIQEETNTSQSINEEVKEQNTNDHQSINEASLNSKKTKHSIKKSEENNYIPVRYFDVDPKIGLTQDIVEERKNHNLTNKVSDEKGKTILGIIFSNLFTFFNLIFLIITICLVSVGSYQNLLFLATVIPNLIIGIVQEIKAKKTIEKLSLMSSPKTLVIRDGIKQEISVEDVVLDDIVIYSNGNQICADSVVLEGNIEVNESMITGESDAISKKPGDCILSGSFVTSGTCVVRTDKIGKENYIEKLAGEAKKYRKPNSELLKSLNVIFKVVSVIIIPLGVLTFINNYHQGASFIELKLAVETTAGSMVGMIPAGLFLLTSMALAVGVIRLGKNNTLVQELYCIETLARVDVLCLDKTGTITDGTMKVWDCIEIQNHTDYTIREIVGSMMNAFSESNATSDALINYFDKNSILKPINVIPFSSKRKYSAVTFENEGTFILGAPEFVLTTKFDTIKKRVERYTSQGCRVLVIGYTANKVNPNQQLRGVSPVAIIVIQDHIRDEASDTIRYFKQNGVEVRVISGDNPLTVSYIAKRVGIEGAEKYISLDGLTDDEVREIAMDYTVFGRVSPSQKKVLVETMRANHKTVAMTGDGVNDILALKEADCSIAMASGSEATRYVAHLVLMDSNFSSMPKVVNEGRRVINNIQKTSTLFLVKTLFAISLTVMYLIIGENYIFVPSNLSMIEWFAIGMPAFFIALQPNNSKVCGKFIVNVIKSTLPGALTVILFHMALYFLKTPLIADMATSTSTIEAEYKTLAILITSMVSMTVLYKVCQPFNWLRVIAFSLSTIGCIIMVSVPFAQQYLGIVPLSKSNFLLLLIFILITPQLIKFFSFLLRLLRISK